jgi:TIR domain
MKVLSGRTYPNGFLKSRLYEVYLSYRDFQCNPEDYCFDLEFTKLEEQQGRDTCHWYRDSDGCLIVADLRLARDDVRLEITPNGFRQRARIVRVFISYAREDGDAAAKLYSELRGFGFEVWFDSESLQPGARWRVRIEEAIKASDFIIALLSSRSVKKRGYVQKEIRYALEAIDEMPESDIFLIPARLDDCKPSHRALYDLQWIDLFPSWESGLRKIERVLRAKSL